MGVTIIIPAYHEEDGIAEVLGEILEACADDPGVEIVVVDDASEDGTGRAVEEFCREHDDWPGTLRVVTHKTNRGYGAALKTGLRESSQDTIVIIDADGTYPAAEIPGLVSALDNNEMAVGARTGPDVNIPLVRRPAKWVLSQLANYLSGQKIPDMNSGLRAMRRRAVERHLKLLPDGFSFTTTITMALLTGGDPVAFQPINYRERKGRSKIRPIRDTLNFLSLLLRTTIYFNPLKVFLPLSLLCFLAAAIVFGWSWRAGQILDATVSILIVTGVQIAVLGLLADLVVRRSSG